MDDVFVLIVKTSERERIRTEHGVDERKERKLSRLRVKSKSSRSRRKAGASEQKRMTSNNCNSKRKVTKQS